MRIRVYATFRPIVGGKEVDLPLPPGTTVRALVLSMVDRWPELGELLLHDGALSRRAHVFVDGRSTRYLAKGDDTVIEDGQEIDVLPAVAGG